MNQFFNSNPKILYIKYKNTLFSLLINIIFVFIYFYNLSQFPPLHDDEGYFSNPAYDLIKNGKFRTYCYRGYIGLEEFTFWQPPFFMVLLALSFLILGVSLFSGRLISVIFALIGINIYYRITLRFLKEFKAFISTFLSGTMPYYFSQARMMRMDMVVSTLIMLSFYFLNFKFYNNSLNQNKNRKYLILAGVFSGLALLSHPNGLISIILNPICIIFNDMSLKNGEKPRILKRIIFNIREKKKIFLLYLFTIFFVILPYLIIILIMPNLFLLQISENIGVSVNNIIVNILTEYKRYHGIAFPYLDNSFINLFPREIQFIFLGFILSMFFISFLVLIYLTIGQDNKEAKILLVYIIGIIAFFGILEFKKTPYYLCIFTPYLFLLVALFFSQKNFSLLKLQRIKNLYINKLIPQLYQKIIPIYKIAWVLIILISHITILGYYYTSTLNRNPYYIRSVLENEDISKNEVIAGNSAFYPILYDYDYLFFLSLINEKHSFKELIERYDVKIVLYDSRSREEYGTDEIENYLEYNCTFIKKFYSSNSEYDPIYIYEVN